MTNSSSFRVSVLWALVALAAGLVLGWFFGKDTVRVRTDPPGPVPTAIRGGGPVVTVRVTKPSAGGTFIHIDDKNYIVLFNTTQSILTVLEVSNDHATDMNKALQPGGGEIDLPFTGDACAKYNEGDDVIVISSVLFGTDAAHSPSQETAYLKFRK